MPTYQYACTACGHELETVQSFSDDPLTQCPECEGRLRKLFGSVGTTDIAEAVTAAGVAVGRHEVRLPEGPIRATGEYEVALHLHSDVDAAVQVVVAAEA